MPLKIAIVDDDARLAKSLKSDLLNFAEIDSVITSTSGIKFAKELAQMSEAKMPEVIVMDISMGLADEGIQATRMIKQQFPHIDIIMFTISDEDERIFEAFKAGAMGYLLKNEPPAFILKTILDVKAGGAQMSPTIARKAIGFLMPATIDKNNEQSTEEDKQLTVREIEILEKVAKGSSYQQIADQLFISVHTVKKHIAHIFEKLHVTNKVEAIRKLAV
ncbi:MAG: LuxR C-terminal-related transcriptional regulator [Cyclobacteriaceae bacterium]